MSTFDPSNPLLTPAGAQLAMHGDDWLSDRDKHKQARAEAARKKAALACAKKLEAAAEALTHFMHACNECRDGSGDEMRGVSDGRYRMIHDLMEYASWLEGKYEK